MSLLPFREYRTTPLSPVMDSSVLIDMFDTDSPRHEEAKKLGDWLIENRVRSFLPWTAMWEMNRTIARKRKTSKDHKISMHFNEQHPIVIERIPIDATFFQKYFISNLPYTKAADSLFLTIAFVDNRPLISEDNKLLDAAKECGVAGFKILQYLSFVGQKTVQSDP